MITHIKEQIATIPLSERQDEEWFDPPWTTSFCKALSCRTVGNITGKTNDCSACIGSIDFCTLEKVKPTLTWDNIEQAINTVIVLGITE